MPVKFLKDPVNEPQDVCLTERFVRNTSDFGDESVDEMVYAALGMEDAYEVSKRWQPDTEGLISLAGVRTCLERAAGVLPDDAAAAYVRGVNMFIDSTKASAKEEQV